MQEKEFSFLSGVICVGKMPLEFGDDFCLPCESTAWIGHEGNDPIRRSIAITVVVDVQLPEIHAISLVHRNSYLLTVIAVLKCCC